jgi:hypothetical protein
MKIEGRVGAAGPVRNSPKAGAAKGTAAEFAEALQRGDAEPVNPTGAVSPLSGIEGLFALQEVGEDGGDERAQAQGEVMLDRLEELKRGLLLGRIAPSQLDQLARLSADAAAKARDPRLKEILNEIELRAQVELAKLAPTDG